MTANQKSNQRTLDSSLNAVWLLAVQLQVFRYLLQSERTVAASAVHDLNNLLSAAEMHLRVLGEKLAEMPAATQTGDLSYLNTPQQNLDAAERALARMERITGALQDYVQAQSGELWLDIQPAVDLGVLLDEILEEQGLLFAGRRIAVQLAPSLPPLAVDRDRLARVLINLLSNACKYTPRDALVGVRAHPIDPVAVPLLSCDPPTRPGPWVLITAWDLGPGIPPDDRAHLFTPYYRLARDRPRPGLGLGLYICRSLCEAHGGRIWLDDVPGASFGMLWPAASVNQTQSLVLREGIRGQA